MLQIDVFEDEEKPILDTSENQDISVSMNQTKKETTKTRYYNGVLPSSNYPGFNESRVNLIE